MKRSNDLISGVKVWVAEPPRDWPYTPASVAPTPSDLETRRASRWPVPAEWCVRFLSTRKPVAIDVELYVENGRATVTGVAVRTTVRTDAAGSPEDPWRERAIFSALSLSARELQRLPLATYARAARAVVVDRLRGGEGARRDLRALQRIPRQDRGAGFYADIEKRHDKLVASGEPHPSATIAREIGEKPETVRVWVSRAKKRQRNGGGRS